MNQPFRNAIAALLSLVFCLPAVAQEVSPSSKQADFAALGHYAEADAHLLQTKEKVRVVFLGDSITEYWGSHNGVWFTHPGWINRGIGGQTTAQLLLRERQDVLALHPEAVVLEGSANDMRLGWPPQQIRDNLRTMGELAEANHIRVFIPEMTPVCDCVRPLSGLRTVERIHELNQLIADLCREKHWTLMHFNAPLADANGLMRAELTVEGVHPNDKGYALLAPVVEESLRDYR